MISQKMTLSIKAMSVLVIINAIIWLAFALIIFLNLHPAIPESPVVRWVMVILAFLTSVSLFGLLATLRRYRIVYFLLVGFLSLIAVVTIMDEFGLADLVVLILTLAPIALLVKDREWFFQAYTYKSK